MNMENIPSLPLLIRQQYQNLTGNERQVADYVLNNTDKIPGMRIHDLAVVSGVANSAVIRFCKALGFSGFSEFKYSFSSENANPSDVYLLPTIKHGDGTKEIFNKVFTSNIHSLYETIQHLDMEQAARAVELMQQARNIVFFGTGSSETTALHAAFHLTQFGYTTFSATNGVSMMQTALNLTPEDVAVGISYCGHTIDTSDALRFAKENGAATIAITSYDNGPLCEYADVILLAPPEDIPYMSDGAFTSTHNSLICILDSLTITLACQNYDNSLSKIHARNTRVFPRLRR